MADGTDVRLARMRAAMGRMLRAGRQREFDALGAAYAALKAEQMEVAERERREAARARRARQRPVVRESSRAWRLPRGFASPLAAERARGVGVPREEPVRPAYGLRPWRSVSPGQRRIWRP